MKYKKRQMLGIFSKMSSTSFENCQHYQQMSLIFILSFLFADICLLLKLKYRQDQYIIQLYLVHNKFVQQIMSNLNKSFDGGQSSHYLPPISRNDSANITKTNRSQSHHDISPVGNLSATPIVRRLIQTQSLRNIQQYEGMNQKQLLRQHQNLLKILKKYQQLIDINLAKKQKQKQKQSLHKSKNGEKKATKQQVMAGEISNNKKIIENHLRQIKDLQSMKNQRKLHEVLDEKSQVTQAINKIKKQIFQIKNKDTMASKDLMTNRGSIQKQLHDAQKDLKTQLTRNAEYKKKIEQLTDQLKKLKQQCSKINIPQLNIQSQQKDYIMILAQKKMQLQQASKNYARIQQSIQQVMINKTKRNKGVVKQIEGIERRITEMNTKIQAYKEKVARYQKVIEPQGK